MIQAKTKLQKLVAKYEGCEEQWKIKLAATTIVEMGIPNRLWEDLMQEVMLYILQLKLRPIEGVRESTALYTRIRNRIIDFLRKEKHRQLKSFSVIDDQIEYTVDILQLCGEDSHDILARAVRAGVAQLDHAHQKICRLFMQGYTLTNTAKILRITRRELRKEIAAIRRDFAIIGIEEIITWRENKRI